MARSGGGGGWELLGRACPKRAREEGCVESAGSNVKLNKAAEVAAGGAQTVHIYAGLGGASATVQVEPGACMDGVRARLREAYPEAPFIKLSACGSTVVSTEALLQHAQSGEPIFATFMKEVEDMSLEEIHEELAVGPDEFRGHLHTLSRMTSLSSTADVGCYLCDNQLLLTPAQAQQAFDALVPKVRRASRPGLGRSGPRAQLVLALHSFCLDPYAIWEPDDDSDECLWANMRWGGTHLRDSSRYVTRGQTHNLGAGSSSSSAPERQDVNDLRSVLRARRSDHAKPLDAMVELQAYEWTWRSLQ